MSVRVHQLAKDLGLTSPDLILKLKKLKIKVKGHMSTLDEDTAEIVRQQIVKDSKKEKAAKISKKTVSTAKTKEVETVKPKPSAALPVEVTPKIETVPQPPAVVPEPPKAVQVEISLKKIEVKIPITVKDLSIKLNAKPNEIIKEFLKMGVMATINQYLDEATVSKVAKKFGFEISKLPDVEEELVKVSEEVEEDKTKLVHRPPVITLMGHVDHGKTSLLDMIRKSRLTEKESGGITQHIGAYDVKVGNGFVTFLDTPGHEAFTAMRARGATATDVVVLVVAADDGVMPQTIEAIDHAKAAQVPIVVALNKVDKPQANVDKVKKQLMELGLTSEDWGGKTITLPVSAKTGQGINELLEMLLLEAEMLELKANPNRLAKGVVIEAELSKGSGPMATVLVQNGTLKVGDIIVSGLHYGRIRAMINDRGQRMASAGPSMPVEISGISGLPLAGETFYVVEDERKAKEIVDLRQRKLADKEAGPKRHITLEDLYQQIKEGKTSELKIILKADVQGSIEALRDSLEKLSTQEVRLKTIHAGVGEINESDVMLAIASDAIVIGFHVEKTPKAGAMAEEEKVDVRVYRIIYETINDIKAAMEGLLTPHIQETFLGRAEVRQVFKVSKAGIIAGSFVTKGKISRQAPVVRLLREGNKIFEGKISSLKRFKDDVREVAENFECGISLEGHSDIKTGDLIEAYQIEKIARRL